MKLFNKDDLKWNSRMTNSHWIRWSKVPESLKASSPRNSGCSDYLYSQLRGKRPMLMGSGRISDHILNIYIPTVYISSPRMLLTYISQLTANLNMNNRLESKVSIFYGSRIIPICLYNSSSLKSVLDDIEKGHKRSRIKIEIDFTIGEKNLFMHKTTSSKNDTESMQQSMAIYYHFYFSMIRAMYSNRSAMLVDYYNLNTVLGFGFWESIGLCWICPGYSHWPKSKLLINNEAKFKSSLIKGLMLGDAKTKRITCSSLVDSLGVKPPLILNQKPIYHIISDSIKFLNYLKNKNTKNEYVPPIKDLIKLYFSNNKIFNILTDIKK